ncbi:MAG: TonB-dependent receptor [Acidobacteria bacterium]|nr:TonB-dependent receptor [Acidobacteriota bacterium]
MKFPKRWLALLAFCAVVWPADAASAQGVTTGAISGIVVDQQQQAVAGATVLAVHEPSGTSYEGVTRADGRFSIPGMRVGGPYTVTVAFTGGGGVAFAPETQSDVTVNLGVSTDLTFTVTPIAVQEEVTVIGQIDPVFSSSRTGAATAIRREEIALLPTLNGRLDDVTRLTPQASGGFNSFVGQDGRMNNITVDGSSFNATFGVASSQPGDRTNVAPISLEAIEQIQVSVAPFDVRQGSFIAASVNTVTRSGTNELSGSFYHRFRSDDWVGTEAAGRPVNPGTFKFRNTGGWAGGPILRNRWFAFGNYEDQKDTRPLNIFRANRGGEPVAGNVTRVLASDLEALSAFLRSGFNYETGPFEGYDDETPAKRFLLRSDYNINNSNKVSFRYNHLDSFTDTGLSSSASALRGRGSASSNFLWFQNSNYQILENIRSGIGEWNAVIGTTMANSFQSGYTYQDESRASRGSVFPLVDIFQGGTAYTTFGFEPFTFQNELRYSTFQLQDNFTKFTTRHSLTFGAYAEKFHSDNVFWSCCPQSGYSYNSLADFYTDVNGYLANQNRTVSPVTLGRFHIRWSNIPGLDKPLQPLDVWYTAGYAQDEWRPARNLTLTAGLRFDVSRFKNTAFANPAADALTFRDERGNPVQYETGRIPDPKVLWSPRIGVNWDVNGNQVTQVRGGTGVFSGRPAYVWISNQLGNTGVLIGERLVDNTTAFPFHPDPNRYKPTNVTGGGASSYALNVTDLDFTFPQVWRTNVAVDRRLPWGFVSTTELLYAKDINGIYYINANLPAPQGSFAGPDNRVRWVGVPCAATGQVGGCVNRINNDPGNQVTVNYVLKNGDKGSSWNFAQSLQKSTAFGLSLRGAYSYGISRSLVDPESTAATSYGRMATSGNPNDPVAAHSLWSPGHRVFALVTYTREYFSFGSTSVALFWEARHNQASSTPSSRISYVFGGDMNNDSISNNDLIYVPRDRSDMNFVTFTQGGRTFTAEEQAAAFERFIEQDPYLRNRRGQYAERYGAVMPMLRRADLSIVQDVFRDVRGKRNALQVRLDITNVGNLLNDKWGVGRQVVASVNTNNQVQVLTSPGVDAQGRPTYRLAVVNNELLARSFQSSAFTSDVYQLMLSLRYSFN